jgi:hypothetical protein
MPLDILLVHLLDLFLDSLGRLSLNRTYQALYPLAVDYDDSALFAPPMRERKSGIPNEMTINDKKADK